LVSFPPCKINLGLNIIRKRADGYHDISTCFYPIPWTDILEIIPSDELAFTSSGLDIPGATDNNLCLKAYALLKKDFQLSPVKIHLHKIIPMGAGVGGGSSDAAYTLKMLNEIFQLHLSVEKLHAYASRVGSDCSFFITHKPMMGSGRGELLSEISLDLKGKYVVIVKPDVHVSTAEAYAGVTPHEPDVDLHDFLETKPLSDWRTGIVNDFEHSVFKNHPSIKTIKEKLYGHGAVYASMSGSGASVFGVFEEEVDPRKMFVGNEYWCGVL